MFDRILVVAATPRELAVPDGWATLLCGVGPVDAAAITAAALAHHRPLALLHVGIAGARRAASIEPPALVVGTESIYCDLDVPPAWAPSRLTPDPRLLEAACRALPAAARHPIGTAGRVGGTAACEVECMEGFAVLRAAALAGVPAVEVRSISNQIEEADRRRWRFDDAFAAIVAATPALVREMAACVS
ncbi:MAG: hypothetical protein AB7O32_17205 [Vicinamibacterales bacterium]